MGNHGPDDVRLLSACPLIPGLDDHGCSLHVILRLIISEYIVLETPRVLWRQFDK